MNIRRIVLAAALCFTVQGKMISFAGYTWRVKIATTKVGPGPNLFSDSTSNVWVDTAGRLHLKITKSGNKWYCAEIAGVDTPGYGTYRFYLDTPVDNLDRNVVLGLFTWNDDPAFNHREIDIEFARWANPSGMNGWYTVQPPSASTQLSFNEPSVSQSTHMFTWQPAGVAFQSLQGTTPIASYTVTTGIPQSGGENVRMNLWLFQGNAPSNRKEVEVIVKGFEFVPQ